jgi:hypothetical protein
MMRWLPNENKPPAISSNSLPVTASPAKKNKKKNPK